MKQRDITDVRGHRDSFAEMVIHAGDKFFSSPARGKHWEGAFVHLCERSDKKGRKTFEWANAMAYKYKNKWAKGK